MTTKTTIALTCALVFAATVAFAHHAPGSLGTVRITQPVMAGGTTLQPGTYEMRDTGEHLSPLPGQSPDAMVWVEFVANGKVVARDGAEIMTSDRAVGTSGGSTTSRPRVDRLKDNEFVRISTYRDGSRYLIHLRPAQK
jgi:hypothetical protein